MNFSNYEHFSLEAMKNVTIIIYNTYITTSTENYFYSDIFTINISELIIWKSTKLSLVSLFLLLAKVLLITPLFVRSVVSLFVSFVL